MNYDESPRVSWRPAASSRPASSFRCGSSLRGAAAHQCVRHWRRQPKSWLLGAMHIQKASPMLSRLLILVCLNLLFQPVAQSAGAPGSLSDCNELAALLNKDLPARIDRSTWVRNTLCVSGRKRVVLVYRMQSELTKDSVSPNLNSSLKSSQLNSWCTDPQMLPILKLADVKYVYSDARGVYVGEIYHAQEDCRR